MSTLESDPRPTKAIIPSREIHVSQPTFATSLELSNGASAEQTFRQLIRLFHNWAIDSYKQHVGGDLDIPAQSLVRGCLLTRNGAFTLKTGPGGKVWAAGGDMPQEWVGAVSHTVPVKKEGDTQQWSVLTRIERGDNSIKVSVLAQSDLSRERYSRHVPHFQPATPRFVKQILLNEDLQFVDPTKKTEQVASLKTIAFEDAFGDGQELAREINDQARTLPIILVIPSNNATSLDPQGVKNIVGSSCIVYRPGEGVIGNEFVSGVESITGLNFARVGICVFLPYALRVEELGNANVLRLGMYNDRTHCELLKTVSRLSLLNRGRVINDSMGWARF